MQSVNLSGVGPFARKPATAGCGYSSGSFELPSDERQQQVQNFHRIHDKTNVSMSVNPKDLVCLTCPEKHAFVKDGSAQLPVCIALTDQSFPPYIAAKMSESCVAVLRVEDGKLSDLDMLFRDVFRKHVSPVGHLPHGSVVMVGSVSHLSLSGLSCYAEELVRTIRSISMSAGNGTTVIPAIHMLLGGVTCPVLIRQLLDLDSWLLSSQLPSNVTLPSTRNLVWDRIKSDNPATGPSSLAVNELSMDLPLSVRHPRKARTVIPAPADPLPGSIAPLSLSSEIGITASLVAELNTLHCLNLSEEPEIKRDSGLPTAGLGGCKLVMLGGSHTSKIAALTRHSGTTEYIQLPGQLLSTESVVNLDEKIASLNLGEGDILYLDLYSNSIYMGSDEFGMPVPAFKSPSGSYHMTGCLETAPEAFLRKRFSLIKPMLQLVGNATIICVLPLPRYVKQPCCSDEDHMVNWAEADFMDILVSGSNTCTGVLKAEGEKHGLTIATFNPLSCFTEAEDLADIKSSAGLSIWREDDPVHLSAAAYNDIAAVLASQANNNGRQPTVGYCRRRLASVIPVPARSVPAVREPEWISGELRSARGGPRGGQRGGPRGGQWGGRGGVPGGAPATTPTRSEPVTKM